MTNERKGVDNENGDIEKNVGIFHIKQERLPGRIADS